jgi:hypothetical protein
VPGSPSDDPEQHGHELDTLDDCKTLNGGNYDCACYYVIDNPPAPAPQDPTLPKPHGRRMSAADRSRIRKKGQVIKIDCIRTKKGDPGSPLAAHHRKAAQGEPEQFA